MKSKIELKIIFPSENEGSVVLINDNKNDVFGELLVFARYSLQQIANFGGDEVSASIASALIDISNDFAKFLNSYDPYLPRLVEDCVGSKMFVVKAQVDDDLFDFNLSAKGFGFLGKGLVYYGPNSILLLLRYLSTARKKDRKYQSSLAKVAGHVGTSFFNNEITFENRATLPLEIVNKCFLGIADKYP